MDCVEDIFEIVLFLQRQDRPPAPSPVKLHYGSMMMAAKQFLPDPLAPTHTVNVMMILILFLLRLWRRSIRFLCCVRVDGSRRSLSRKPTIVHHADDESCDASIPNASIQPPTPTNHSTRKFVVRKVVERVLWYFLMNIIWLQMWREGCSITPTKWISYHLCTGNIFLLQFACPLFIILVGVHKLRRVSARKEHFRSPSNDDVGRPISRSLQS